MKAAICYEFGKPVIIDDVTIDSPKRNEVKVRLAATAICHSDIHDVKGELLGPVPFVPGHEAAGYIDEVGPEVTGVKPGDPVVVTLLASCGGCYNCLRGMPHLCPVRYKPKTEMRLWDKKGRPLIQKGGVGGFAEYALVKESQVVKIPRDMPLDRAALLACGVITGFGAVVNRAKVKPFSSVVVTGTGGVGLNAIQGAAFSGAYPIIAVDILDSKLEAAKKFGATHAVNGSDPGAVENVRKITDGQGADYVFITVGNTAAIRQGFDMSGTRGTTVIVGLPRREDKISFSPFEFIGSERSITGSSMGSTNIKIDIPRLITLYKTGKLKLDELITNRYPLEKINEGMESVIRGEALRNVIIF